MSRIGKQPVAIPAGVKVQLADGKVRVEGPKGKLEFALPPEHEGRVTTARPSHQGRPGPTTSGSTAPCTA